jgi:hypothetical protein
MKKSALLAILFTVIYLHTYSQVISKKVNLVWGPKLEEPRRSHLESIITTDETGMYILKSHKQNVFIEHFTKDMNKTLSVKLVLKHKDKEMMFRFISVIKSKIYVFSTFLNQEKKKNYFFVQEIDKKTLLPTGELKKIGEIDFSQFSRGNNGHFDCSISEDESKILVYNDLPYEKKENDKFELIVYDNFFNLLWDKQVVLPYIDKLFETTNYIIDNQGAIHFLGKLYNKRNKDEVDDKVNYRYQIISFYKNGNQTVEYPIEIKDYFLKDMNIAITADSNIICTGFYSKDAYGSIKGSYFIKINSQSKEIIHKNFKDFDFELITEDMSKKQVDKTKKKIEKGEDVEMYNYDLNEIILRDDGGAVLIAEQYWVTSSTTYSTSSNGTVRSSTNYYYNYGDILVINIDSNGEIEWTKKISKIQTSVNDDGYFSSYTYCIVKDKIYFVYNERFNVNIVELNNNGEITKEKLFNSQDYGVNIRVKSSMQINDNELVLFGHYKKTQRFVKVSFKE